MANPPPTAYLWTKEGDNSFRIEDKYLKFENISHVDSGEYTCTVTNVLTPTHGVASTRTSNSTTTIAVKHKPGVSRVIQSDVSK